MRKQQRLRLGEILVQQGNLAESELERALAYQSRYGGRLGNILTNLGLVDEHVVRTASQSIADKGRLGEQLIHLGVLSREQLDTALAFQAKSGGLIGDILLSLNLVDSKTLYRAIAAQQEMGRIGNEFDLESVEKFPEHIARASRAVIVHTSGERAIVAVDNPLSVAQVDALQMYVDSPIEQVLATPAELEALLREVYSTELIRVSRDQLAVDDPEHSANRTVTRGQLITLAIMLAVIVFGLCVNTYHTAVVINVIIQLIYFVVSLVKFSIILRGARSYSQIRISDEEVHAVDERVLPIYTILVPMYREGRVIRSLVANLDKLDYPKHKLDIRLLVEEDDAETLEVLQAMALPHHYAVIVVPHSQPKTKPKACNYGLIHARGEYVVIYDAEDRPDADQLKKVYLAYQRAPEACCCIQAKLNYFNSEQNLLTRWFTQEYSMWFDLLLPGLMQLDIPIPLGGTSNHFKTQVLKELNAWDPYNVTEDADLGIRLYKAGFSTGIVNSRTWEEANSRVGNWIRQRSRWIKGYMQTWLVHMRNPLRLWRQIGTRGMLGTQVVVLATPLLPLINPFLWAMIVLWYLTSNHDIPLMFPGPIYYIAAVELFVGNFIFVFSNVAGVYWVVRELHSKEDFSLSFRLIKHAISAPLYWIMMSIASYKAAWQLITKPFYWEKTEHGLIEEDTHENTTIGA